MPVLDQSDPAEEPSGATTGDIAIVGGAGGSLDEPPAGSTKELPHSRTRLNGVTLAQDYFVVPFADVSFLTGEKELVVSSRPHNDAYAQLEAEGSDCSNSGRWLLPQIRDPRRIDSM